jgi:dTDP-4-dehydrorhamnose 3,5-epimerase-like enzyme
MQDRRYKIYDLKNISTDNFLMTPLELKDYTDFEVKRIYFFSTDPAGERLTGSHCHIEEEDELFVMIQGSTTMVLDDGHGIEEVSLKGPKQAIRIPPMVWHHFKDMSDDAVILALTSTNYDPDRLDYCEDYEEFKKLLLEKNLKVE